jgi:hypothetical protein
MKNGRKRALFCGEGSGRNRLFYCIGVHTARKGFAVFYYVGQLHGCYWVDILKERKTEHDKFEVFLLIVVLLILIGGGVILYLALAGLAIIYSMGANESPRGRRIFFGVLGVVMIVAFVCASIYFHKYGWPL